MFNLTEFESQKLQQIKGMAGDKSLYKQALDLIIDSDKHGYAYLQTWLGMPIIQLPEDIINTTLIGRTPNYQPLANNVDFLPTLFT